MKKARKLYESPTGDPWYPIRDPSGALFIRHEANVALLGRGEGPEQQELLRLIGTLVEEQPVHA